MKTLVNALKNNRLALFVLGLFLSLQTNLLAQAADATTIVTTATDAFEAVSVLVVAMVAFFIIVRIVKGIRK